MHDFIDPSNCCDPKSKVFGSSRHLLWLGCSAEVHLARGDLMHLEGLVKIKSCMHNSSQEHLDTLWEEASSIFLFHSRHLQFSGYHKPICVTELFLISQIFDSNFEGYLPPCNCRQPSSQQVLPPGEES